MTLPGAQRLAGTMAVSFAFAAAALGGELGLPVAGLFAGALVASTARRSWTARLPAGAWTALLVAALLWLTGEVALGRTDPVLAATRFTVLLAVHRLCTREAARDETILLLLSLLLLCAGAALSAELLFGAAFAGYAVTATWALALTHLRAQLESAGGESAAALLRSRRLVSPALLGALAALSLLGLVSAALVFAAFPRVTLGGWSRPRRPVPVSGLADQVDLSGHGTVADDPSVALRVRLEPDPGARRLDLHWRARAFEVWTGRGFRARQEPRELTGGVFAPPKALRGEARTSWLRAEVVPVGGAPDGLLFVPPGVLAQVRFEQPLAARMIPRRVLRDAAGDLFADPSVGALRYVVTTRELPQRLVASAPRPAGKLPLAARLDLELPGDLDPRIRDLAGRLTSGRSPAQAALAVEKYLSRGFAYSRELPGEVADPVADFLFVRRRGHCELFASAMVLLLRAAGVPARAVGGYYGGVRTAGGTYAVRAGDAHAWAEVYLDGLGFVPFDPTPASERGSSADGPWARILLLWDSIDARWRSAVVDYDLLAQGRLLQGAASALRSVGARLSGRAGAALRLRQGAPLAAAAAALALAAGAAVALRGRRRRSGGRRARPALGPDQLRARALWRRARARLRRRGLPLPPGATPEEAVRLLAERPPAGVDPGAPAALRELCARAQAARWGGARLPRGEARALWSRLRNAL